MQTNKKEQFVIELYNSKFENLEDFIINKKRIFGQDKVDPPSNAEVLTIYKDLVKSGILKENEMFEKFCKKHKIRTLSGVSVIAILTKYMKCPGNCSFCPTEKDMPKSYLPNEPAVMRAIACNFDPYKQVKARVEALNNTGHNTSKNEIIIMGGTWSYLEKDYQEDYILNVFKALNSKNKEQEVKSFVEKINFTFLFLIFSFKKFFSKNILEKIKYEQKINEISENRCVGLTLETRPDYINEEELKRMREFGCTRIEIGVQSVFNDVLKYNKRGHFIEETIRATKLMKDAGFKICYHMMPGLPSSDLEKDYKMFDILYNDEKFKPDMIKIYPCVVVKNTEIYDWMIQGKYIPYTDTQLINLLIDVKKITPYWVRINRLIRDIPSVSIEGGNKIPNLREVIAKEMHKNGYKCNCIRCREVKDAEFDIENIEMFTEEYKASDGIEYFLSFEDKDRKNIYSFLRLRIPSYYFSHEKHFIEELDGTAIIREIHTYGAVVDVNKNSSSEAQHLGFGKKLIKEAERIAKEKYNIDKLAVISGVGVRNYYRKNGFKQKGTYMIKEI